MSEHRSRLACFLHPFLVFLALAILPPTSLVAQISTPQQANALLVGKTIYLRTPFADDRLKFAANGQPLGRYTPASFTESGLDVQSVRIAKDHIKIDGTRYVTSFDQYGQARRAVDVREDSHSNISVDIDNFGSQDFGPALQAVFAIGLADLTRSLPFAWQAFMRGHFLDGSGEVKMLTPRCGTSTTSDDLVEVRSAMPNKPGDPCQHLKPFHVGPGITKPQISHFQDASFSQTAKDMRFVGDVEIYVIIDENGDPRSVQINRPLGLGLDEEAVSAVQQYKFKPAIKDGHPVSVDSYIEVRFQIF